MLLGNIVKKILSPFVKGTSLENCQSCNERAKKLNNFSTSIGNWISRFFCPCYWRGFFNRK